MIISNVQCNHCSKYYYFWNFKLSVLELPRPLELKEKLAKAGTFLEKMMEKKEENGSGKKEDL